jgi:hypothetical protein
VVEEELYVAGALHVVPAGSDDDRMRWSIERGFRVAHYFGRCSVAGDFRVVFSLACDEEKVLRGGPPDVGCGSDDRCGWAERSGRVAGTRVSAEVRKRMRTLSQHCPCVG